MGRGFARLDVRANPSGSEIFFLEINPNAGKLSKVRSRSLLPPIVGLF
jgi:D-alanine-D-alanine ligase-like ATP-grasp enzyme